MESQVSYETVGISRKRRVAQKSPNGALIRWRVGGIRSIALLAELLEKVFLEGQQGSGSAYCAQLPLQPSASLEPVYAVNMSKVPAGK
jgi:hypothetical protein